MSDLTNIIPAFAEPEKERAEYAIDEPVNLRPILGDIGIDEVERGICLDTFENRVILRRAKMGWDTVYSTNGVPTGLIQARSNEMAKARRVLSLAEKKPILVDPDRINSDFLSGLDLIAEPATDYLVPRWVIASTRSYLKELEDGGRALHASPRGEDLGPRRGCALLGTAASV